MGGGEVHSYATISSRHEALAVAHRATRRIVVHSKPCFATHGKKMHT